MLRLFIAEYYYLHHNRMTLFLTYGAQFYVAKNNIEDYGVNRGTDLLSKK